MLRTLPTIFFGHGNPMNAIQTNAYTQAWSAIGKSLPRPRAILCISAHWYVAGTSVTAMEHPRTIHDFGGFPRELFEVTYPAPGDSGLAERVAQALTPIDVGQDQRWGLDHGAWSVLVHLFPKADIPVVQLSIDETQPAAFHYDVGKRLAPLRDEGILIIGSGNIVHNLEAYAWGRHAVAPFSWTARFENQARAALRAGQDQTLVGYETLGSDAALAAPTPEHYLPLLYVLGARKPGEPVRFPVEGVDGGSISMLAVQFGEP
ncbi:MAG TPA: 4,5-DOPA dioxygenase extradiol [Candidatus Baltobacteraceae bacterium]